MAVQSEHIGIDQKPISERDRIDLNNEIAGVDTGRAPRFLLDTDRDPQSENSEKKKRERATNMLLYMLEHDAQYAKQYYEVSEKLKNAQQVAERAMMSIDHRLAESDRSLQFFRDNASKLEDGTRIFKSSNGSIYTEDGQRLDDEKAQTTHISDDAPSWEQYRAAQEKHADLLRSKNNIERYERDVLGPAQERMQDQDNPMTKEELDILAGDIEHKKPAEFNQALYKTDLDASIPRTGSVAASISQDATTANAPVLSAAFSKAQLEIPAEFLLPEQKPTSTTPALKM